MSESIQSREAKYGERMLKVTVRFFTNGIAEGEGQIEPKHAWTRDIVRMERNESHGIIPKHSHPFNSLMEIPQVIEKVLIEQGITLHCEAKMAKYIKCP